MIIVVWSVEQNFQRIKKPERIFFKPGSNVDLSGTVALGLAEEQPAAVVAGPSAAVGNN